MLQQVAPNGLGKPVALIHVIIQICTKITALPFRRQRRGSKLSVMSVERGIRNDFQQLHHAAVLMNKDVTVLHVFAGEIHEPGAHFEVARNVDRARLLTTTTAALYTRRSWTNPLTLLVLVTGHSPGLGIGIRESANLCWITGTTL